MMKGCVIEANILPPNNYDSGFHYQCVNLYQTYLIISLHYYKVP